MFNKSERPILENQLIPVTQILKENEASQNTRFFFLSLKFQ